MGRNRRPDGRVRVFDLGGGPHGRIEWGQLGGDARHRNVYPAPWPDCPSRRHTSREVMSREAAHSEAPNRSAQRQQEVARGVRSSLGTSSGSRSRRIRAPSVGPSRRRYWTSPKGPPKSTSATAPQHVGPSSRSCQLSRRAATGSGSAAIHGRPPSQKYLPWEAARASGTSTVTFAELSRPRPGRAGDRPRRNPRCHRRSYPAR
jgi:hypothetical protein